VPEDSPAAPLPRRVPDSDRHVPGGRQGPGPGPVGPAALPKDVLQRIRDALDSVKNEASPQEQGARAGRPARAERPARAGQPASLPQRVPGASKAPEPPAVVARPRPPSLPPSLPRPRTDDASRDDVPAAGASRSGDSTDEITVRLDTAVAPEPATDVPAGPQQIATPRPAEEQLDGQDRPDGETSHPRKLPSHQENRRASRAKGPTRRAKAPARAPDPAPPERPSPSPEPVSHMALVFPLEPSPEEATPLRPSVWPQHRARRGRVVGWAIVALAVISASLAFLLARQAGWF
jgi:hypothetical protein